MSTAAVGAATQPGDMMANLQATMERKALDTETQSMQNLLQALPQPSQGTKTPGQTGNNVDAFA